MTSNYLTSDFDKDAVKVARTMHLAYRRGKFLLERWYSGINTSIADPDTMNLMNRVAELIADYEAFGNAKLNTVLAKSNLTLPGDPE